MPIKITLKTKTNKKEEQAIKNLKDGNVKIGWLEKSVYKYENGMTVAENAYMQEKGFFIKHRNGKQTYVPPRPFLRNTMIREEKKWNEFWKKEYKKVADGKINLKTALNKLGVMVKSAIQDTILSSDGIRPNQPSTLRAKKAKGHPQIPLIDSRKMFEHIDYESEVYR